MMFSAFARIAFVGRSRGPGAWPAPAAATPGARFAVAPNAARDPQLAVGPSWRGIVGLGAMLVHTAIALGCGWRDGQRPRRRSKKTTAAGSQDAVWAKNTAEKLFGTPGGSKEGIDEGIGPSAPGGLASGGGGDGSGEPPQTPTNSVPSPDPNRGLSHILQFAVCLAFALAVLWVALSSDVGEANGVEVASMPSDPQRDQVALVRHATSRKPSQGWAFSDLAPLALLLCCCVFVDSAPSAFQHIMSQCIPRDGKQAADAMEAEEWRQLVVPLRFRRVLWPSFWKGPVPPSIADLSHEVPASLSHTITVDLPRTFEGSLREEQRAVLGKVLHAYAAHNPAVGYTQGMSFIAGVLLRLDFSEPEIFAGLHFIVEVVCPGYHQPRLEGFFRDLLALDTLVQAMLPDVHSQITSLCIPMHTLAADHLISVAARNWPLPAVVRLWDIVHSDGNAALLASFIAMLHMYFTEAVEASKADGCPAEDMPYDVSGRFKTISSTRIPHDIDEFMRLTREFTPRVLDRSAGSASGS